MSKPPATRGTTPTEDDQHSIEDQIESILRDRVPRRQQREIAQLVTEIVVSEQFHGPLPHPRHLEHYDATIPNGAERIMQMAERNLEHTIQLQATAQRAEITDGRTGLWLGAGLFALLIVCALVAYLKTENVAAPGVFLGTAVLGAIALFVRRGGNGNGNGRS